MVQNKMSSTADLAAGYPDQRDSPIFAKFSPEIRNKMVPNPHESTDAWSKMVPQLQKSGCSYPLLIKVFVLPATKPSAELIKAYSWMFNGSQTRTNAQIAYKRHQLLLCICRYANMLMLLHNPDLIPEAFREGEMQIQDIVDILRKDSHVKSCLFLQEVCDKERENLTREILHVWADEQNQALKKVGEYHAELLKAARSVPAFRSSV